MGRNVAIHFVVVVVVVVVVFAGSHSFPVWSACNFSWLSYYFLYELQLVGLKSFVLDFSMIDDDNDGPNT